MGTDVLAARFLAAVPSVPPAPPVAPLAPEVQTTADGWVWGALGLLLALLALRAWVVETGHATLGRTPVKVTVLTVTCGLVAAVVAGLVTLNGGARLVYLVAHPKEAQALEDAVNAVDTTAPPDPAAADPGATDPPDPPDPPTTPTTTPAPPPPTTRAAPRPRPTTRVTRPPVRTTTPVTPPAATTPPTPTTSTKTTTTRTSTPRAARQDAQATGTPPSTARSGR